MGEWGCRSHYPRNIPQLRTAGHFWWLEKGRSARRLAEAVVECKWSPRRAVQATHKILSSGPQLAQLLPGTTRRSCSVELGGNLRKSSVVGKRREGLVEELRITTTRPKKQYHVISAFLGRTCQPFLLDASFHQKRRQSETSSTTLMSKVLRLFWLITGVHNLQSLCTLFQLQWQEQLKCVRIIFASWRKWVTTIKPTHPFFISDAYLGMQKNTGPVEQRDIFLICNFSLFLVCW